jgi:hypothetical protein
MPFRECPQCGDEVVGRADKVFCSPSCKSLHFRAQPASTGVAPTARAGRSGPAPAPVSPLAGTEPAEELAEEELEELDVDAVVKEWFAKRDEERLAGLKREEEEAAQAKRAKLLRKLFDLHSQLVADFLEWDGAVLEYEEVTDLRNELKDAAARYRAHPLLDQVGHPAAERLATLYLMWDKVKEVETHDLEGFDLTNKERERLLAALLGGQ